MYSFLDVSVHIQFGLLLYGSVLRMRLLRAAFDQSREVYNQEKLDSIFISFLFTIILMELFFFIW